MVYDMGEANNESNGDHQAVNRLEESVQTSESLSPGAAEQELRNIDASGGANNDALPVALRSPTQMESTNDSPFNEHLKKKYEREFKEFEDHINLHLDKQLGNFANSVRKVGSSVRVVSSVEKLRRSLKKIVRLFHDNAASVLQLPEFKPLDMESSDLESFPDMVQGLARALSDYREYVEELQEATVDEHMELDNTLDGDLQYWTETLREYTDTFHHPPVQRYLLQLSLQMDKRLTVVGSSLLTFIELGVPAIAYTQQHANEILLNISTVSAILSAVTATTLQFSYTDTSTTSLAEAVNTFWFTSLVFSVGAAVNSGMSASWNQAMYRSPKKCLPIWVRLWIKHGSLTFLVLSVVCFSLGLALFTYASHQSPLTRILTTAVSVWSMLGLLVVSVWFTLEYWVYAWYDGQKWLSEVSLCFFWDSLRTQVESLMLQNLFRKTRRWRNISEDDMEAQTTGTSLPASSLANRRERTVPVIADPAEAGGNSRCTSRPPANFSNTENENSVVPPKRLSVNSQYPALAETSVQGQITNAPANRVHEPEIDALLRLLHHAKKDDSVLETKIWAIKHLKFSPDGKQLAVTGISAKGTAVIYTFKDPLVDWKPDLTQVPGLESLSNMSWSPDGNYVFAQLQNQPLVYDAKTWNPLPLAGSSLSESSYTAWTADSGTAICIGSGKSTVKGIQAVTIPSLQSMTIYDPERFTLRDATMTSNKAWLLCIGTLTETKSRTKPSTEAQAEKRIILYDVKKRSVDDIVPILAEVRHITISRDDQWALVSYEGKSPPELWALGYKKGESGKLVLKHTYYPNEEVDYAGPSCFGGKCDELVLSASTAGDVYIWDRDARLIRQHIGRQVIGKELECIAWNPSIGGNTSEGIFLALAATNGNVILWGIPPRPSPASRGPSITATPTANTGNAHDLALVDTTIPGDPSHRVLGETQTADSGSRTQIGKLTADSSPTQATQEATVTVVTGDVRASLVEQPKLEPISEAMQIGSSGTTSSIGIDSTGTPASPPDSSYVVPTLQASAAAPHAEGSASADSAIAPPSEPGHPQSFARKTREVVTAPLQFVAQRALNEARKMVTRGSASRGPVESV